MRSRKIRSGVLAGIVLTFLVLLMPNVAAIVYFTNVGSLTTTASDGDPTAVATANGENLEIGIGDSVNISVNWSCSDTSGIASLGSIHNFTLNVNKSVGPDRYKKHEVGIQLAPPSYSADSGQLSVQYDNVIQGTDFWVNVTCKVYDLDTSKMASDVATCTITTS